MKRSSFLGSFFLGSVPVAASLLLTSGSALAQDEMFKQLRWFQMTTSLKSAPVTDVAVPDAPQSAAASEVTVTPADVSPSDTVVTDTATPATASAAETPAPISTDTAVAVDTSPAAAEPDSAAVAPVVATPDPVAASGHEPVVASNTVSPSASSVSSTAAPVVDGPVWTLEQLLTQAMMHPAIQTKGSLSNAAKADLEAANWQKYPVPSFEAATIHNQRPSTAFRLQQPLWTAGRITAGIDAAGFRQKSAEAETAETQRDIGSRVISAFAEAQRQQLRQEFAIKSVREHEKLLRLISRRVEMQVSPEVDKGFAQSRLFQAMNDLSLVTQQLSNALNQLSQLAGKSVNHVAALNTETIEAPAKRSAAIDQAMASSPTLIRIAAEEDAAAADIESKKSAYMPQISARYDKSFSAGGASQVMLVLEAQPGAGLSAQSGVDAAIAKREAIRLSREVAVRDLKEQVITDWDGLIAARLREENAEQAKRMTNDVFASYARQYTLGRKTWIDVLNAVREAAQAEMATVDASTEVLVASQRLRLLTGALNIGSVASTALAQ